MKLKELKQYIHKKIQEKLNEKNLYNNSSYKTYISIQKQYMPDILNNKIITLIDNKIKKINSLLLSKNVNNSEILESYKILINAFKIIVESFVQNKAVINSRYITHFINTINIRYNHIIELIKNI